MPCQYRLPVHPHVLWPRAVGVLSDPQILQHAQGVRASAGRKESARCFDQVARPDQMVAAEIGVAFIGTPGNRQTGDDRARQPLLLVTTENRGTGPCPVARVATFWRQNRDAALPRSPFVDVRITRSREAVEQRRSSSMASLHDRATECKSHHESAATACEIDLADQRDVSVLGAVVLPGEPAIPGQVLPAIGKPHETRRAPQPTWRTRHSERRAVALRKEHRDAFVVADERGVSGAVVPKVW